VDLESTASTILDAAFVNVSGPILNLLR
jgi:hypothetical protein